MTAGFPGPGFYPLAWVALAPLLLAIRQAPAGLGFRIGWVAGLCHYLTLLYWLVFTMNTYGNLPLHLCVPLLFLLCAYLALYWGVFCALLNVLRPRPVHILYLIPVFWTALEYLRAHLFSGFPWGLLGYSQHKALYLIQIADVFGVWGVTFLVVFSNSVLFTFLLYKSGKNWHHWNVSRQTARFAVTLLILVAVATVGYGHGRIKALGRAASTAPVSRVSVIQGNIDQAVKWDPAFQISTTKKYIDLSLSAAVEKPDLIVWPETAAPFYFQRGSWLAEMVKQASAEMQTDLLIGSPSVATHENGADYFNSAYLVFPDGTAPVRYDKAHLVPFGEYVPLKRWLPFLGKMVEQVGDFKSGARGNALTWKEGAIGIQICFEIIFPGLSRAMVQNGADFLVNMTNDAWFEKTGAPYQHFSMAVFRAVENRRALVRAANTGISGFIDPAGRVMIQSDLFQEAVLTRDIPRLKMQSLYTKSGDFLPTGCWLATAAFCTLGIYRKRYYNN